MYISHSPRQIDDSTGYFIVQKGIACKNVGRLGDDVFYPADTLAHENASAKVRNNVQM
jgi:hypothetical protein